MAGNWRSKEFVADETMFGHGREKVLGQICAFLNESGIKPGGGMVSIYPDTDPVSGKPVCRGVLVYYQ